MNSQLSAGARKRRVRFASACLAAVATLFPPKALAKGAGNCTAGTTLRLSAPVSSQGSLLLFEIKSTRPLAEVQGEWGGRSVPILQEVARERQRKGLLAVDLEKAAGEYELKVTGQTAGGREIDCERVWGVRASLVL